MDERPLECAACEQAPSIRYTAIEGGTSHSYSLCSTCPLLAQRLGAKNEDHATLEKENVCCGGCGTSQAHILQEKTVGCFACYDTFHETIAHILSIEQNIPLERTQPHHYRGRAPTNGNAPDIADRIVELNSALSIALTQENYEHAAAIRDEMHTLLDTHDETDS